MEVIYYKQEMPEKLVKSIFLMGPSLRPGQDGESWRKAALLILSDKEYTGTVFCPENEDGIFHEEQNYRNTVEWEDNYLNLCDVIVCWCPRDVEKLPGFTTNVEFGRYESSGKLVFGFPEDAERMRYLEHYAKKYNVPTFSTLVETLDAALIMLADGSKRQGGERYVPLFVWKLDSFQSWYQAQLQAGNRLEKAQLLYTFRPNFKSFVFLWILRVQVYVAAEDRVKDNEFVLTRTDISSVCLWQNTSDGKSLTSKFDNEIVLIKEFRSPAASNDGFVRELPSGSSNKEKDPQEIASEEVHEETGASFHPSRFMKVTTQQLAATFSAHKSHLYAVELTIEEMLWFKSQKGIRYGNRHETEITYIEVHSIKDIIDNNLLDFANLGMLLAAMYKCM